MLFLSIENQLFLIITLVFSSFIFLNALVIRPQSAAVRAFGLAFALPFYLTVKAFLTAPYQRSESEALMFLGHFLLILICTIVLLVKPDSDSLKLFFCLPFILIAAAHIFGNSIFYSGLLFVFYFIHLGLTLLNLALVIYALNTKDNHHLPAYLGLLLMSLFLGLWLLLDELTIESFLLMALGYVVCALYTYQNTYGTFYREQQKNSEDLKRLNASIQMEVIRRVEGIERSNKKLLEISKTDSMTGLYVNLAVVNSLKSTLERSPLTTLSILMIDIDNFKHINDSLGHQVGDRCIKTLSGLAQTSFRKDDILGRYGGDEFLILLPSTPPVRAYLIADRFRQQIESKSSPKITISIGIANYPEDGETATALIEAADKALYSSKQKGRNQVTKYKADLEVTTKQD